MNNIEIIPNILAVLFSFVAIIMLVGLARKFGGAVSVVLKIIVTGIFLSVTAHATFELIQLFDVISPETLFLIMGTLLSLGSVLFIVAASTGFKMLRELSK
jgi:hypothetical protein